MTAALIALRAVVSILIVALVGLAFLPHSAATSLAVFQKYLTRTIERRRA